MVLGAVESGASGSTAEVLMELRRAVSSASVMSLWGFVWDDDAGVGDAGLDNDEEACGADDVGSDEVLEEDDDGVGGVGGAAVGGRDQNGIVGSDG